MLDRKLALATTEVLMERLKALRQEIDTLSAALWPEGSPPPTGDDSVDRQSAATALNDAGAWAEKAGEELALAAMYLDEGGRE